MTLRNVPLEITFKLSEATVVPIIIYRAEVWGESSDHDSWDKNPIIPTIPTGHSRYFPSKYLPLVLILVI